MKYLTSSPPNCTRVLLPLCCWKYHIQWSAMISLPELIVRTPSGTSSYHAFTFLPNIIHSPFCFLPVGCKMNKWGTNITNYIVSVCTVLHNLLTLIYQHFHPLVVFPFVRELLRCGGIENTTAPFWDNLFFPKAHSWTSSYFIPYSCFFFLSILTSFLRQSYLRRNFSHIVIWTCRSSRR